MAHMCMNYVRFSGDEANMEKFISEIKRLSSECTSTDGVFIGTNKDVLFDIEASEIDKEKKFAFQTKWTPELGALSYLSKAFKVSIVCDYEELGFNQYGSWECDSEANVISHVSLTDEEFELVEENDEGGYEYNRKKYGSKYDAYEEILEQKKLQTV